LELRSGPRLVDLRTCQHPARELEVLRAAEPALLVWREGSAEPVGVDRRSLRPAPVLAVWSAPPGPDETLAALQAARPAEILVFARPPEMDSPAAFLKTLLGMLKYKLNRKMHEINLDEIAAAAGHRAAAVRLGLDCLAARGLITVVSVTGPIALIEPGGAIVSLEDGDRRLAAVLKETTAYREFFRRLPLASLFPEYGGSPAARIT